MPILIYIDPIIQPDVWHMLCPDIHKALARVEVHAVGRALSVVQKELRKLRQCQLAAVLGAAVSQVLHLQAMGSTYGHPN